MSDKSEMKLIADCHGATEVNLVFALGFYSMTGSAESLKGLERSHELVDLHTEQKIGSWQEALENEMNLKHNEGYHKTADSKYLVGSSAALYCNAKYPKHLVVVDART